MANHEIHKNIVPQKFGAISTVLCNGSSQYGQAHNFSFFFKAWTVVLTASLWEVFQENDLVLVAMVVVALSSLNSPTVSTSSFSSLGATHIKVAIASSTARHYLIVFTDNFTCLCLTTILRQSSCQVSRFLGCKPQMSTAGLILASLTSLLLDNLIPQMGMMVDLKAAKDSMHLHQFMAMEYNVCCPQACILRHAYPDFLSHPQWYMEKKTSNVKLCTQAYKFFGHLPFFDIFMLFVNCRDGSWVAVDAFGWKIIMSKYASQTGDKNPLVCMSRRESSVSIIFAMGHGFTNEWLVLGSNAHIVTHIRKQWSC